MRQRKENPGLRPGGSSLAVRGKGSCFSGKAVSISFIQPRHSGIQAVIGDFKGLTGFLFLRCTFPAIGLWVSRGYQLSIFDKKDIPHFPVAAGKLAFLQKGQRNLAF